MIMSFSVSLTDQERLVGELDIFKVQGRDKHGNKILSIIGKQFLARKVSLEALKKYLEENVFPELENKPFSLVYVHTGVQRSLNFPGISTLKSVYEAIPIYVKNNIVSVYIVHPGLQARLFLATFGRLIFTGGLHSKITYKSRLEFLWDNIRRSEIDMPEFVYEHDEELEYRPPMEYAIESDHRRLYCASSIDSPASMYSMRCIA